MRHFAIAALLIAMIPGPLFAKFKEEAPTAEPEKSLCATLDRLTERLKPLKPDNDQQFAEGTKVIAESLNILDLVYKQKRTRVAEQRIVDCLTNFLLEAVPYDESRITTDTLYKHYVDNRSTYDGLIEKKSAGRLEARAEDLAKSFAYWDRFDKEFDSAPDRSSPPKKKNSAK